MDNSINYFTLVSDKIMSNEIGGKFEEDINNKFIGFAYDEYYVVSYYQNQNNCHKLSNLFIINFAW